MSKRMGRTESVGDSLCPVCHEHTEIFAIGPCDHPICYRCSTRMRILCDQMYCPICRGDLPQIVFLTTKQKYDEVERRNCIPNRKFKILLEDESVEEAYEALLEFRCRICDKGPLFDSFSALQTHIRRVHSLFFCDLCVSHLKIFPFERKYYNRKDLATHRRTGDPDNRSYRGHPLCRFCDERYMDNDELYRHLRKSHYYCHFCDANNSNEYFNDYPDLKEHFRTEHFLCTEEHCGSSDTRFTNAFASEIDLKAHKAAEHLGNMSRAQAKELRTIDVNFSMAPRRRGYDASATSPEDEEMNASGRGYRDRRSRRNESRPDSHARPSNPTPPPPESVPTPSPANLGGDDFPTLGNAPAPYVPAAQKKPAEQVEDFPSLAAQRPPSASAAATSSSFASSALRSVKSSSGPHPERQKQSNFSSLAAVVTSTGPSQPSSNSIQSRPPEANRPAPTPRAVSANTWAAPRLTSGEDFPTLGGDKKKGPNYVSLGVWSKKQKKDNAPRLSSAKSDMQPKSRSPELNSLTALGHAFGDDGDFPSLGSGGGGSGAMTQPATWVQKNAKPNKNKKSTSSTPLGKTRDPTLNNRSKQEETVLINGTSENKTEGSNSKKKKKQKGGDGDNTNNKAATEDSGLSLSSIASEIDAAAMISLSNPPTASATSNPEQEKKQDAPVLCSSPVNSSKKTPTSSSKLQAPVTSEQAPSGEGKENKLENEQWEKIGSRRGKTFKDDDFPSLQAAPKKTAPPPGFQKSGKVVAPPPGLNKLAATLGRTPPGLGSTTVSPPSSSSTSSGSNEMSIPTSVKLGMYPYSPPPEAPDRNRSLVAHVRQLLETKFAGFDQFRTLSADYRASQVTAQEYHRRCQELLGKEKFLEVLPELVVLLPDILKQHELAQAHKDIVGAYASLDLQPCFHCHQLLKAKDLTAHLPIHVDLAPAGFTAALPIKT